MGNIEKIEEEIQALSSEELAQFRAWFPGVRLGDLGPPDRAGF